MYAPPPGYEDMLADAEGWAPVGGVSSLDVPGVGTVVGRRPGPAGIAALAMSANPDLPNVDRAAHLVRFVGDHLDDGELERLYFEMMMDTMPSDTLERVSRQLATWGTARPYVAVVTLAVIAACHWRTIRVKLVGAGVVEPMALGSMHMVLDLAETLVVESFKNAKEPQRELASFYRRLYGPSPEAMALNGDGYDPTPPGFSEQEMEAAFDAFSRAAR